jgi:indole-3-glycerol phosphate synthase
MGYLEDKAHQVRARRLAEAPRDAELVALMESARAVPPAPSLESSLCSGTNIALIAEFKRRSPSGGQLAGDEDPGSVARSYEEAGASGISVLTDKPDFDGSLNDLETAAKITSLPVLRKDFIVDAAGLFEARLAGAAAALLIMRILTLEEVGLLIREGRKAGLECLVEVHDEDELKDVLESGATLIGINNRNLETLQTDLAVTERLAPVVPAGITLVSESGIRSADDVKRVQDAGVHAVLVGEALMRLDSNMRSRMVTELAGVSR